MGDLRAERLPSWFCHLPTPRPQVASEPQLPQLGNGDSEKPYSDEGRGAERQRCSLLPIGLSPFPHLLCLFSFLLLSLTESQSGDTVLGVLCQGLVVPAAVPPREWKGCLMDTRAIRELLGGMQELGLLQCGVLRARLLSPLPPTLPTLPPCSRLWLLST